jgi:hypothetical protein
MDKLAKVALNAAKKIATLYETNDEYQTLYGDIWKFVGKVRLPQPYCPVNTFSILFFVFCYFAKFNYNSIENKAHTMRSLSSIQKHRWLMQQFRKSMVSV